MYVQRAIANEQASTNLVGSGGLNPESMRPVISSGEPEALTLGVVKDKLQRVEGFGVSWLTFGRSSCAPPWTAVLPGFGAKKVNQYNAQVALRFGIIPVAVLEAKLFVDPVDQKVVSNEARFSTSDLRWGGRIAGGLLGAAVGVCSGLTMWTVLGATIIGAKLGPYWLDKTFTPLIHLTGSVSGGDVEGRLLWTGSARGFVHSPVALIRHVLCKENHFTFVSDMDDNFTKCYRRVRGGLTQEIVYQEPYSYGTETVVHLKNFPLTLAARLGIAVNLPI